MDARDGLDAAARIRQGRLHGGLGLGGPGLEGEQARHDGEAVLDPVAHLAGEEILPGQCRAQQALGALALDRAAEQVGEALHEGDVGFLEHALAGVVHLEHPEGPVPVLDQHVDRPADAVLGHQLGRAEAGLLGEMVRDHRPAGLEGEAGRGGEVGPDPGLPDHLRAPADAGAHQQRVLAPAVFQRLAELGPHPLRAQLRGPLQQVVDIGAAQGLDAELGQDHLLAQAVAEIGRRESGRGGIRGRVGAGFHCGLIGLCGHGRRQISRKAVPGRRGAAGPAPDRDPTRALTPNRRPSRRHAL